MLKLPDELTVNAGPSVFISKFISKQDVGDREDLVRKCQRLQTQVTEMEVLTFTNHRSTTY